MAWETRKPQNPITEALEGYADSITFPLFKRQDIFPCARPENHCHIPNWRTLSVEVKWLYRGTVSNTCMYALS